MNKNKSNRFMPFIMALCVVIGIIIGTFFSNHSPATDSTSSIVAATDSTTCSTSSTTSMWMP